MLYQDSWWFWRGSPSCVDKHTLTSILLAPFFVYIVFLVRSVVFTTLEKARPARPHAYWPGIGRDLGSVVAYSYIIFPVSLYLARYIPGYHPYPFSVEGIPIPLRIVLYLVVADLGYYWVHRLMHTRHFWRTHMWHHSPKDLYWLAGMRSTLPQQFLVNIPYFLAYPVLGVATPWWAHWLIAMHVGFKNDWQHMNVSWPSRWLEWIFVTPRYHQIHHSVDPRHHVANLGDLLTIWDRLFGTYVDPGTVREPLSFGIDAPRHPVRLVLGV
jgi:sterol desaturase/sphingolipid hydroxylase (fatty acid hydroxylase superfamily)